MTEYAILLANLVGAKKTPFKEAFHGTVTNFEKLFGFGGGIDLVRVDFGHSVLGDRSFVFAQDGIQK